MAVQGSSFPDAVRLWEMFSSDPAGCIDYLSRIYVAMIINVRIELL